MPLEKVGDDGYRWGPNGKIYHGEGAKEKAERQGKAIHVSKNKKAAKK